MQAYAVKAAREGKQETSWHNPERSLREGAHGLRRGSCSIPTARPTSSTASASFAAPHEPDRRAQQPVAARARRRPFRACPISIRAPSCGISRWSIPTTAGRSIFRPRPRASTRSRPTATGARWRQHWEDGSIKLALTHRLLTLRNAHRDLFTSGDYEPIEMSGPRREHVVAFARTLRREAVIVAVGRHFAPLTDGGRDWPVTMGCESGARRLRSRHRSDAARRQACVRHDRPRGGVRPASRCGPACDPPPMRSGTRRSAFLVPAVNFRRRVMNDRAEDDTRNACAAAPTRLWEEEGRPEGRDEVHWEMARELVAIEDDQRLDHQAGPPRSRRPDARRRRGGAGRARRQRGRPADPHGRRRAGLSAEPRGGAREREEIRSLHGMDRFSPTAIHSIMRR